MADPTRENESIEARFLRENWSSQWLRNYNGKWIAVRGEEIVAASTSFEGVAYRFDGAEPRPLLAFVWLDPMA
jgi:hypothetical protein